MAESLLVDSSCLLAAIDEGEQDHLQVQAFLKSDRRPLLVTDYIIAEVDYLVLKRLGSKAEQAFIQQIIEGIFMRESVLNIDLERALEIVEKYSDHEIGITDATLMALSERKQIQEILTLDHRHFSVFRDRHGRKLKLLPA